jgi:hypothetical protein
MVVTKLGEFTVPSVIRFGCHKGYVFVRGAEKVGRFVYTTAAESRKCGHFPRRNKIIFFLKLPTPSLCPVQWIVGAYPWR